MDGDEGNEGNGNGEGGGGTEGPKESLLTKIKNDWAKGDKKPPSTAEGKKMVAEYQEAAKKVEASEKALKAAKEAEYKIVEKLARAYGGQSLRIGGIVHDFSSRGDTVFFRKKTSEGVIDL